MRTFPSTTIPEDRSNSTMVREWYAQLAEAAKTPGLAQHLVRRTGELLPRVAAWYDRLRALPRRFRRAILRGRRLSLAGVAMLLALGAGPAYAGFISVGGSCTLANAITAANTDAPSGGCAAGSGADSILLNADVILTASLPSITTQMSIQNGSRSLVDGAGHTCFHVTTAATGVLIAGLNVTNCVSSGNGGGAVFNEGGLTVTSCTFSGNTATGGLPFGGAISSWYESDLLVVDTTITGNDALLGGGIANFGTMNLGGGSITGNTARDGGGIYTAGPTTINGTVISGNQASGSGGGMYFQTYNYSTVTVLVATISGNAAGDRGGGIAKVDIGLDGGGGILDIQSSTISGNSAAQGGGIASYDYRLASLSLEQTTVSGNTATGEGGGIWQANDYAYTCDTDSLVLTASTISNNTAGTEGGGVWVDCNPVQLSRSLISGNSAPSSSEMVLANPGGVFADDYNVVGYDGDDRSAGFTPGATDIVPSAGVQVADILAPLGDYGGSTLTHALVPGSPALDSMPTSSCFGLFDQRAFPRPAGPACDSGSVEGTAGELGGSVTGFIPKKVLCSDNTTGEKVQAKNTPPFWSCKSLGLEVATGDKVQTSATGNADGAPVGGEVTGMTPSKVFCQNLTTGQNVKVSSSATSWDCGALGLAISPGDRVTTGASGTAE